MWSLRNKAMAHTAGRGYTEIAETKLKKNYRKAKEFLKGGFVRHPIRTNELRPEDSLDLLALILNIN